MGVDTKTRPIVDAKSLDTPSAAAALTPYHNSNATRPNTAAKALDVPSAAAALAPYHSNPRPTRDTKSLDTPAAAAALTPYRNPNAGYPAKAAPPLKDPANHPFTTPSTAAAAHAITPLKLGYKPSPDSKLDSEALAASRADSLPSYKEAVKASHALNVVHNHNDKKGGAGNADPAKYNDAIGFLDTLRAKSKEGVYTQFLDILAEYTQGKCRPQEVSRKVTLLFHKNQHPDLVEEMYKWTPWQHRFYLPFAGCTR